LLTLFESLDDPFVGRPGLVEGPGDKLLPDGDGLFSPAADVGEGRGGYSLAGGLSGVGIEDEEIPPMSMDGDEPEGVEPGGQHPFGGLHGLGLGLEIDAKCALGIQAVGSLSGNFHVHDSTFFFITRRESRCPRSRKRSGSVYRFILFSGWDGGILNDRISPIAKNIYSVQGNIVVTREKDKITFRNPGCMLISIEDFYAGSQSLCRNPILQKFFIQLGIGEKAGSGADFIVKGWIDNKQLPPRIEEKV